MLDAAPRFCALFFALDSDVHLSTLRKVIEKTYNLPTVKSKAEMQLQNQNHT
jgi:hypothetical protein